MCLPRGESFVKDEKLWWLNMQGPALHPLSTSFNIFFLNDIIAIFCYFEFDYFKLIYY